MTRESATSGHTRQLPPGDKTKEKQTRHATKTNQKQRAEKDYHRLSVTFFFPRFRVLLIHFERKIAFFFSNSFQSSVGNKPSSKCDNLTKDKQDTRNKTWTHSIVVTGKKKICIYGKRRNEELTACSTSINQSNNVVQKKLVSNFKVVEGPHFGGGSNCQLHMQTGDVAAKNMPRRFSRTNRPQGGIHESSNTET